MFTKISILIFIILREVSSYYNYDEVCVENRSMKILWVFIGSYIVQTCFRMQKKISENHKIHSIPLCCFSEGGKVSTHGNICQLMWRYFNTWGDWVYFLPDQGKRSKWSKPLSKRLLPAFFRLLHFWGLKNAKQLAVRTVIGVGQNVTQRSPIKNLEEDLFLRTYLRHNLKCCDELYVKLKTTYNNYYSMDQMILKKTDMIINGLPSYASDYQYTDYSAGYHRYRRFLIYCNSGKS